MKLTGKRPNAFLWIMPLFLLSSCDKKPEKVITPAFYYWRTRVSLSETEKHALQKTQAQHLYIKFFDIIWDSQLKQARPAAFIKWDTASIPAPIKVTPVIFITNETLLHIPFNQLDTLAGHISQSITALMKNAGKPLPDELQLDCDWTINTRKKFFQLIRFIRKKFPPKTRFSATIRLHQVKYTRQTGVPPIDRGMLMFYNMADWKKVSTKNSIYDLDIAAKYLATVNGYPLPLDIALPLFRWAIIFRNGKPLKLINNVNERFFQKTAFSPAPQINQFNVVKDTLLSYTLLRRGDRVRYEKCEYADLLSGKNLLLKKIKNHEITLSLFHLDETLIKTYTNEKISALFHP